MCFFFFSPSAFTSYKHQFSHHTLWPYFLYFGALCYSCSFSMFFLLLIRFNKRHLYHGWKTDDKKEKQTRLDWTEIKFKDKKKKKKRRNIRRRDRWSVTGNRTFEVNFNSEVISIFNFIKILVKQSQFCTCSLEQNDRIKNREEKNKNQNKENERRKTVMQASWFT